MKWKFSANTGFFGVQRNRFVQFQPPRTLDEQFALVSQIEGMSGIELKYPRAFDDLNLIRELLEKYELELSAINVDTKDIDHFRYGALSANHAAAREEAVRRLRAALDIAADFGVEVVTTCPLADGYDYPFQRDHALAWTHLIDTVRAAASHRSDVKLCLEYQPHEPHSQIMISNVGKVLYVCHEVGLPNVGANLDIGHSFAALENPAESIALLARSNRLFYVHTNDNTGNGGDWDMMSGSVHFWHWLEVLYTLQQVGYDGWLGGDIVAKHISSPVKGYSGNTLLIQRMTRWLDEVGDDRITALIRQDDSIAEIYTMLVNQLMPGQDTPSN